MSTLKEKLIEDAVKTKYAVFYAYKPDGLKEMESLIAILKEFIK